MHYNTRFEQMWGLITQQIDFRDRTVIDLGCGYGDFIYSAHMAGARLVKGVDMDEGPLNVIAQRFLKKGDGTVVLERSNVESLDDDNEYDIAACFSVIPYLRDADKFMRWMSSHAFVGLVECQYYGDGPGPEWAKDDEDMANFLFAHWDTIFNIGYTTVQGRNTNRTIWLCTRLMPDIVH